MVAVVVMSASLLGCGAAPYVEAEGSRGARGAPEMPETPPGYAAGEPAVVVVLQEPGAEPPTDTWIPEEPREGNPLAQVRAWRGDYDCPQGNTEMTLHILGVRGNHLSALFAFHHVPTGVEGRYLMAGRFDPETYRVTLTPGAWIVQPEDYVSVGMQGDLSEDGSLFAGRMDHPLCGAFRLRPAR
ncbi:Hypothetical protein CAP_6329 [Chondromyces apiculatus DSM 436]|uniref:Uncharacterized protein n=1 Tax=Chondromyces apiculatus DSM 436 TaxID=1192034 RepID=A0A017T2W8_9BACT|nr:Hypothetical protein CAP_6329 [Chondromyces apiculatus DSM 436]